MMVKRILQKRGLFTVMAFGFGMDLAFGQVPFTEVTNTGDLGSVFRYNFGASWGDFNGDGYMDLFVANALQQGNDVFRNNGDLTFTRMSSSAIGDLGNDAGDTALGIWADIDSDGDTDLFVANYSQNTNYSTQPFTPQADLLYLNNADGTFTKQADTLFGPTHEYDNGASVGDFDGDGFLDVLVVTWPQGRSVALDRLFRNNGNLGFNQVAEFHPNTIGMAAGSWCDYDEDGDIDLMIFDTWDGHSCLIYQNQKEETGVPTFIPFSQFPNGLSMGEAYDGGWADYDNDGDFDFFLSELYVGVDLYTNEGGGNWTKTSVLRESIQGSRGGSWIDYDNDGDQDLIIASIAPGSSPLSDVLLVENQGAGSFAQHVFLPAPPSGRLYRPPALADVNNDGFVDVLIPSTTDGGEGSPEDERDRLWTNNRNSSHWLKLSLHGTESNPSAVGAIARVRATIGKSDVWQMRQVEAGGSLYAQHDIRLNFGLGDATVAEIVRIHWPSGLKQELTNVAADQILQVIEPPRIRWDSRTTISWSALAAGFQLQSAVQPEGPWTNSAVAVEMIGRRLIAAILPNDEHAKFYRLQMP